MVDGAGSLRLEGRPRVLVNEINAIRGRRRIPGPLIWVLSGLTYPKMPDRLIEEAFERHARRRRRSGQQRARQQSE